MRSDDVVVRSVRVLRGPNLYAYMPVLHIVLDTGPYEDRPSNTFPGFVERLTTWLRASRPTSAASGDPAASSSGSERGPTWATSPST